MNGPGTVAYYATSAGSVSNTFTAGSAHLHLADSDEYAKETISGSIVATVAANQWRPGQVVTVPIRVINHGEIDLTYGLAYTATDSGATPDGRPSTLAQFSKLSIKGKGNGQGDLGACTTANFSNGSKWQESIISGQILAAGTTVLWRDTTRLVTANDSEVLCIQIEFTESGAGVENNAMGGTLTVSFLFTGRETFND
jgi:hypothetical protein